MAHEIPYDLPTEMELASRIYAMELKSQGKLPIPPNDPKPARHFAILTCMDARIDPAKLLGLHEGDAHVIRNGGGRMSEDALRSLIISYKLLHTKAFIVIHHTDCGLTKFKDVELTTLLEQSLEPAEHDAEGRWYNPSGTKNDGSSAGRYMNWLSIDDAEQCLVADVKQLRECPLIPQTIPIYPYMFNLNTGRLETVEAATAAAKPIK